MKLNTPDKAGSKILINIIISLFVFFYFLIKYNHASGGDMTIIVMNVIFGIIQLLTITIIGLFNKKIIAKVLLAVVICQALELIISLIWGYNIHQFLTRIHL